MTENEGASPNPTPAQLQFPHWGAEKAVKLGLPLLFVVILIGVYGLSLVSPGLLDEQFLVDWLKDAPKLQGSSGPGGFLAFPGLDRVDSWGITTRLLLFSFSLLFGKALGLYKFLLLAVHGCATLLTYKICKHICQARIPATIAGLLFALYPLHYEATAWLGGFGSELAGVFFLFSLLIYLQGRQSKMGWGRIALVGIGMLLSVTSSTLIWTGCLAFALFELVQLVFKGNKKESPDLTMCLISILLPVLVAGGCLAAAGTAPDALFPDLRWSSLVSCLRRAFLPINEINLHRYSRNYLLFYAIYPFITLFFLAGSSVLKRAAVYFLLLFALLALPVSGIAMLQSDLYGERWLYAASAPLCMFLACCLSGLTSLRGKLRVPGIAFTTIVSVALAFVFTQNLANEIAANRNAARVLKSVQRSIRIKQEKDHLQRFIIRDFPEKISIVPLYSPRGPVLFDSDMGLLRSNPIPDGRLKEILRSGQLRDSILRWDGDTHSLLNIDLGPEKNAWADKWSVPDLVLRLMPPLAVLKNVSLSPDKTEMLLESNSEVGPMLTFDGSGLNCLDDDYLYIDALIDAPASLAKPQIELHWQTSVTSHYEKRDRFTCVNATTNDKKVHRYLLSLRSNGWTTDGRPTVMALGFPAGARVRLQGMGVCRADKGMIPGLVALKQDIADPLSRRFTAPYFNYPIDEQLGMIALSDNAEALLADYSVADNPLAAGVVVELSCPDKSFLDANSNHLSNQTFKTISCTGQTGRISIPVSSLPAPGVYSLRVIARDTIGGYLGQFSNPICYQVPRKKGGIAP